MKNKNVIFSYMWVAIFLIALIMIFIPKTEETQGVISLITFILMFIMTLVLIFSQAVVTIKCPNESKYEDKFLITPNIGCSLIMFLSVFQFLQSLGDNGVAETIVCLITFMSIEALLTYAIFQLKNNNADEKKVLKKYVLIQAATYISLVIYYFCLVVISLDYFLI